MENTNKISTKLWISGIIIFVLIMIGILSSKNRIDTETIKIGEVLPLTGAIAPTGEQIKNGVDLAISDINSSNNRKIEAVYEDSKLDPKTGVSAINKLIDTNGVKYVHVAASPIIAAVQPITEKKGLIMAAVSQSPSILKNSSYTLRIFFNLDQAMDKFLEFINSNKYKKVAVLYQNTSVLQDQINYLEEKNLIFAEKEKYNMEDKDFKTVLLKIKLTKPDLLILLGYGANFPVIFKQINEIGLDNIPVLGSLDFLEVPKESLSLYGNVIFLVPAFYLGQTNIMKKFITEYQNKFSTAPNHQAAYAYDTVKLLYDGVSKTDGTPAKVMEYLKNFGNYDGVSGKIILQNGNAKSDLSFARYQGNNLVPYNY